LAKQASTPLSQRVVIRASAPFMGDVSSLGGSCRIPTAEGMAAGVLRRPLSKRQVHYTAARPTYTKRAMPPGDRRKRLERPSLLAFAWAQATGM
jgi:hypothetical protein